MGNVFDVLKERGLIASLFLVPLTGLEPVQCRHRGILSPLCLPIPPQRHYHFEIIPYYWDFVK